MSLRSLMDNRRVRYWMNRARMAKRQENRDKAWERALDAAERADGWLVLDCPGKRSHGRHPIELTRVSKMGAVYGRKHYRSGKVGAERAWGRK